MRALGALALLGALAGAGPAFASGEPGISYTSRYYRLHLSSGFRVMVEGDSTFFEDEEADYRRRLGAVVARIDAAVDKARAPLALVEYDPEHREREDADTAAGPRRVLLRSRVGKAEESVTLVLSLGRPAQRAALDRLLADVVAVVAAARPVDKGAHESELVSEGERKLAAPGLEITVRPETRWMVAKDRGVIERRDQRHAERVQAAAIAALRAAPELALPAEWPKQAAGVVKLDLFLGDLPREVVLSARVAEKPDGKVLSRLRDEIKRRLQPDAAR